MYAVAEAKDVPWFCFRVTIFRCPRKKWNIITYDTHPDSTFKVLNIMYIYYSFHRGLVNIIVFCEKQHGLFRCSFRNDTQTVFIVCEHMHTSVCLCVCVPAHACMHVGMWVHICICACMCVCMCLCTCMQGCVCLLINITTVRIEYEFLLMQNCIYLMWLII